MEETIRVLVNLLADAVDRLEEAEAQAKHWQELCGKEAIRANKAEARAMAAGNRPNGGGDD